MPSKQVTDREKSSHAVAAAASTHAAAVGEALARELSPHLKPGETMPNVALLVQLLGRKVRADHATLAAADTAHETELSDDDAPRQARDEAVEKVRAILVDLRSGVDSAYGLAGLAVLGLKGETASDPTSVAGAADAALGALQDPKRKLPKARRAGNKLDRGAYVDELKAELPDLRKALVKVAKEEREEEATQLAKDEALAANDRSFSRGAAAIAALAAVGGLDDLADKVKPSGRRPGRTAVEDGETVEAPPA
jgi:hypothetical protein